MAPAWVRATPLDKGKGMEDKVIKYTLAQHLLLVLLMIPQRV